MSIVSDCELYNLTAIEGSGVMMTLPPVLPGLTLSIVQTTTNWLGRFGQYRYRAQLLIDEVVKHESIDGYMHQGEHGLTFVFDGPIRAGRYGIRYIEIWSDNTAHIVRFTAASSWP